MKLGLKPIAGTAAIAVVCACSAPAPEDDVPQEGPYGDVVVVGVSGRGFVSSDPLGIYCGNDGDQRRCESEFLFPTDDVGRHVTLEAKTYEGWTFAEWTFTTEGQIPYEPLDPSADRKKPVLVFTPGTVTEPSGKVRPRRYRVNAVFEPTAAPAR